MRTAVRTVLLAAPLLGLVGLSACSGSGAGDPGIDPGSGPANQSAEATAVPPKRPHGSAVCHRTGADRWVPLSLPLTAAEKLVVGHGDFLYDTALGQCCTRADCPADIPCTVLTDADGNPLGTCGSPPIAGVGTDPVGFLLSIALFGSYAGAPVPLLGTITHTVADTYFFSFSVGTTYVEVPLASFTPPLCLGRTAVEVTFPPSGGGLVTYSGSTHDILNFMVTDGDDFTGTAQVALDDGSAYFDLSAGDGVFCYTDGECYSLIVNGLYTAPITTSFPAGTYPAGLYRNVQVGTAVVHLLVVNGEVFGVVL